LATIPVSKLQYGYLWWSIAYPYKDKTVRAFFAGGNGGRLVMGIPDLDLVVAIYAGNYSDPCSTRSKKNSYPSTFCPRSMLKNRFRLQDASECSRFSKLDSFGYPRPYDLWTKSLKSAYDRFLRSSNLRGWRE
jgi:hypothetical protein